MKRSDQRVLLIFIYHQRCIVELLKITNFLFSQNWKMASSISTSQTEWKKLIIMTFISVWWATERERGHGPNKLCHWNEKILRKWKMRNILPTERRRKTRKTQIIRVSSVLNGKKNPINNCKHFYFLGANERNQTRSERSKDQRHSKDTECRNWNDKVHFWNKIGTTENQTINESWMEKYIIFSLTGHMTFKI